MFNNEILDEKNNEHIRVGYFYITKKNIIFTGYINKNVSIYIFKLFSKFGINLLVSICIFPPDRS